MKTQNDYVDVTDQLRAAEQLNAELAALEAETADVAPSITKACEALAELQLTKAARQLLDDACDNVAKNRAIGLTGSAKAEALGRAELFNATNCDLIAAIEALVHSTETSDHAAIVYSTVYAVQKAACFGANLSYRRHLDRNAELDLPLHVDPREDINTAPCGLGPDIAPPMESAEEMVKDALSELHVYLGLLAEAFGWDPDRPMPYLVVQTTDGGFVQIHDVQAALDLMEVRRQESRGRQQDKRAASMKRASSMVMAVLRRSAPVPAAAAV